MVYLVTGNINKVKAAILMLKPFNIEIEQVKLDITEPQDENIAAVAEFKVNQAFEKLNKPVLITDTGWNFPALNGFPGPFMHYIQDWLNTNDLINLMKCKKDLTVIRESVAIYQDSTIKKVFHSKKFGHILLEPKGEGIPIDRLATFRKDEKTIAECLALNISSSDESGDESVWTQFGKWYVDYNKHTSIPKEV
jgi:non-canonical purine NTP pyrophosphatase (RdgB/HAM1 family)